MQLLGLNTTLMIWLALALVQEPRWRGAPATPFMMHEVRMEGWRWDPDPIWVSMRWQDSAEVYFKPIRDELVDVLRQPTASAVRGAWAAKARTAFGRWYEDHQNPEKLFRAASYLGVTTVLDTKFCETAEFRKMEAELRMGISFLKAENIPPSYEFCRRAYMLKAGDSHGHRFRDLAFRLLKRDPVDRGVLIAMVREYTERGSDPPFEAIMFKGLFACAKTKTWREWDDQWIARAMVMYGVFHKQKSYYDKAATYLNRAIARTPKGVDPTPMKKLKEHYLRERDLPNFGRPTFPSGGGGTGGSSGGGSGS